MNIIGLELVIIVISILCLVVSLNFFGKKITNKYLFWSIPSFIIVIYFIVFRFSQDWINLSNYLSNNYIGDIYQINAEYISNGSHSYSILFSKALLLDLCPFLALSLPLSLMFDKSRKIANVISPFAIFGGAVTLFGGIIFDNNAEWSANYIFIGSRGNSLYLFMHAYLLIAGISVLSNCKNKKWSYFIWIHLFAVLYFSYISTIAYSNNVRWNVTGIVINDWLVGGEYHLVSQIFNLSFPYIVFLSYSLVYIFIILVSFMNIIWNKKRVNKRLNSK